MRTYGRTGGRPLSPRRQALIDDVLPKLSVPDAPARSLDPRDLFETAREVWLEIGFGGGEHLVAQATRNPDVGLIGCEPFVDGMAKALAGAEAASVRNARFHMGDAREVLERFSDSSTARVFILFPDPWPKKKQRKRRLIQPDFLESLHRVCAPGARVRFATDIKSYADEALLNFLRHGGFVWTANRADDWRTPPTDHMTTRYERKRLGDCAPVWLEFVVAQKAQVD